jgi:NAD(P)-dependent dehydrogenase (short-subunit alcohol dehydrogenase family)
MRTGGLRAKGNVTFAGAVCVVTGASSGLGRRFAIDLAAAGGVVVGLARRADLLATLESELRRSSPRSSARSCDVSEVGSFVGLLQSIENEHGRIDVLVNCAGISEPSGTRTVPSGDPSTDPGTEPVLAMYRQVMETNFFAAVAGTEAALPGMLRRGSGIVVNVSSDSARAPGPGEPAYCASKAALSAFTESLSLSIERDVPASIEKDVAARRVGGSGTSSDEPRLSASAPAVAASAPAVSGVHLHVLYPGWVPTAMGTGAVEGGMAPPPRMVRRTAEQVSRLMLARMGGPRMEIDATLIARLAPIGKTLAPGSYRKAVLKTSGNLG